METVLHHRHWRAALALALSTTLLLAASAAAAGANPSRPLVGYTRPALDQYAPPDGCAAGSIWRYTANAVGYFSHLGRVAFTITQCTHIDAATGQGSGSNGTVMLVSADGDTLLLAQQSTFQLKPWPDPTVSKAVISWHVVSGTGRFADATGSGGASATGDLVAGTTVSTWWGTIAY